MDALTSFIYQLSLTVAIVAVGTLFIYFLRFVWKSRMSSRQTTTYWREKFKDETTLHEQQETLLRASVETEQPDFLLRSIQENKIQHSSPEQLIRASKGPD